MLLDELRGRLEDSLLQVEDALVHAGDASVTVTPDQSGAACLSEMDAPQLQAMATGIRDRLIQVRMKIEAALARISAGRFGICCQCEGEIDNDRLERDPAAVFCATCMVEREIHGDRLVDF